MIRRGQFVVLVGTSAVLVAGCAVGPNDSLSLGEGVGLPSLEGGGRSPTSEPTNVSVDLTRETMPVYRFRVPVDRVRHWPTLVGQGVGRSSREPDAYPSQVDALRVDNRSAPELAWVVGAPFEALGNSARSVLGNHFRRGWALTRGGVQRFVRIPAPWTSEHGLGAEVVTSPDTKTARREE